MALAIEEEGSRSGDTKPRQRTPMTAGGGARAGEARKPATWRGVAAAAQEEAAHALLLCFTSLVAFRLDGLFSRSWWVIFTPLWLFHAVVARDRFSLPAPLSDRSPQWVPCHSIVATPLLVAFELLLCVFLESTKGHGEPFINLKLVFLPLLALEIITLVDNFRMCGTVMLGNGEIICEAIWERLPHFWVAISMVFLLAATSLMLLKLCGDAGALGWWDLFINFGISQCFAFLVCTRWSNPMTGRQPMHGIPNSPSMVRYCNWNSSVPLCSEEDPDVDKLCGLQDIGCRILLLPIVIFQVLLCMHLEGTPASARLFPFRAIFSPVLLFQVAAVLVTAWRLMEMLVILLKNGAINEGYLLVSSKVGEFFTLIYHGSRLIGWWSIDEGSKEEQARLYYNSDFGYMSQRLCEHVSFYLRELLGVGCPIKFDLSDNFLALVVVVQHLMVFLDMMRFNQYNTFCSYPPEMVKKMPKRVLVEEVQRLQLALGEQIEIAKSSKREYERLKNEKILCRICFERDICVVLLPCRHHILCQPCFDKCRLCPICRVPIKKKMSVYDAVS